MENDTSPATPDTVGQDPLPESNWLWRRLFVFVLSTAILALVWFKVDAVADAARAGNPAAVKGLLSILRICLGLVFTLILFYLLAPSAEQTVKMIQTAKLVRSGVTMRTTTTATSPDGSSATAVKEAGPALADAPEAPAPVAPPSDTGSPVKPETDPLPWERKE